MKDVLDSIFKPFGELIRLARTLPSFARFPALVFLGLLLLFIVYLLFSYNNGSLFSILFLVLLFVIIILMILLVYSLSLPRESFITIHVLHHGKGITGATVCLRLDNPLEHPTGPYGNVTFSIPKEAIGKRYKILVEKGGYEQYMEEISLQDGKPHTLEMQIAKQEQMRLAILKILSVHEGKGGVPLDELQQKVKGLIEMPANEFDQTFHEADQSLIADDLVRCAFGSWYIRPAGVTYLSDRRDLSD